MNEQDLQAKLVTFFSRGTPVNAGKNHRDLRPKEYWDDLVKLSMSYPEEKSLIVDFHHVDIWDRQVANWFLNNPTDWLDIASDAISEVDLISEISLKGVKVRMIGLPKTCEVNISSLRAEHLEKPLTINCVISKASEVRPAYSVVNFVCLRCYHETRVEQLKDSDKLQEPYYCSEETCGKKGPFKIEPVGTVMYDHQYLKVQEPIENLRGKMPEFLNVSCADDIAGKVNPGDKVVITGILKGKPRTGKDGATKYQDFVFVANSISKSSNDYENIEITPEELMQVQRMKEEGTLIDNILGSIAPAIFGMEDVKLGLVLQMFGGEAIVLPDGTRKRGDIHIFLVGDPGVAKSQLLAFIAKISPRAVEISGRSSSEAGLTGGAVKDENDGKWWVMPGALTLADGGVCCADEIDKMKPGQLGSIHEALEQQMVHINKVVKADLWTRTAFLGAANPKYGRYDKYQPLVEQITHGDAFLSRMDMIFILQDQPNQAYDEKLADHILGTLAGVSEIIEPKMDLELLRKVVAYARTHIHPKLTPEAWDYIKKFFVSTRGAAGGRTNTIPITARTLEAAYRLSTAYARMRLSNEIEIQDAEAAVKLFEKNLRCVGIDPETGELDANVIACGMSMSQERKLKKILLIIKELSGKDLAQYQAALKEDVIYEAEEAGIKDAEAIIQKLKQRGEVFCPAEGFLKVSNSLS